MTRDWRAVAILVVYAALYAVSGALSFLSAYLQSNAATVWAPSGIALGLLLNKGRQVWPSILLGSFVLNLGNLATAYSAPVPNLLVAALMTACANTAEALLAAYLTERFAAGPSFAYRSRNVLAFVLLCAPLPPVLSTVVGVGVDRLCGISVTGDPGQIILIWYIANVQSIVLFGSLMVLLPHWIAEPPSPRRLLEGVGHFVLLGLAVLIVGNLLRFEWLEGWPRPYFLIPFVVWASFRFGSIGGVSTVLVITVAAAAQTIYGYQIFPAETAWRSLMYLQVYLGMLSLIALMIGAALAERDEAAAELENQVSARTGAISAFLQHARLSTALAAHELKGPILQLRSGVAGLRAQLDAGQAEAPAVAAALGEAEANCAFLLKQVAKFLPVNEPDLALDAGSSALLEDIVLACFSAHRVAARANNVRLDFEASAEFSVAAATEIEQILNTLIGNAIRHAPSGSRVRVLGEMHDGRLRLRVTDEGSGIPADKVETLFRPPSMMVTPSGFSATGRSGMGLYLARKEAAWIGATLTYVATEPPGATFLLEL